MLHNAKHGNQASANTNVVAQFVEIEAQSSLDVVLGCFLKASSPEGYVHTNITQHWRAHQCRRDMKLAKCDKAISQASASRSSTVMASQSEIQKRHCTRIRRNTKRVRTACTARDGPHRRESPRKHSFSRHAQPPPSNDLATLHIASRT